MLLLGFGAVSLVHKDAWDVAESVLHFLHVNPDRHRSAQVFLNLADNVTDRKLWAMAAGATAYSIVRFVEAYGLWRARAWAEWFALISGALYVPFEAYELVRHATPIHVAVLLINLGVVFYMLYLRLSADKEAEDPSVNAEGRRARIGGGMGTTSVVPQCSLRRKAASAAGV